MADSPTPAREGGSSPLKAITRKVGPLPLWAYAAIVVAGYFLYTRYKGGGSSSASTGTTDQSPVPGFDAATLGGGGGIGSTTTGPAAGDQPPPPDPNQGATSPPAQTTSSAPVKSSTSTLSLPGTPESFGSSAFVPASGVVRPPAGGGAVPL